MSASSASLEGRLRAAALRLRCWSCSGSSVAAGATQRCLAACVLCLLALGGLHSRCRWTRGRVQSASIRFQVLRSGVFAAVDLMTAASEADATAPDRLDFEPGKCGMRHVAQAAAIVMVFDESSFDATVLPTSRCAGYQERFRSSTASRARSWSKGQAAELVHRVQRAHRIVVRSYGRLPSPSPAWRRPDQARPALCVAASAGLQDLQPLFLVRGVFGARKFQTSTRYRALPAPATPHQRAHRVPDHDRML